MRTITGSPVAAARFRGFVVSRIDLLMESRYHGIGPVNSPGFKSRTNRMTDSVATNSTPLSDVAQALGAQDFEPWEGEFDAKLFSETMENHRVNGHMALAVMHQTKEKIMDGFRQLPEPMATMTDAILRVQIVPSRRTA